MRISRKKYLMAVLFATSVSLYAQSAPHLSPNTFEVGGFIGSSYGLDEFRVMGGGTITYGINRSILPYAEFCYCPGIPREQTSTFQGTNDQFVARFNIPVSDFHGGVHIRMPIRESRVVPYAVFGMGVLHTYGRTVEAEYQIPGLGTQRQQLPVSASTDFAVNWGGGLRYYTTQRFGMRLEAKAYKPTGQFTGIFGKVEWGFFFQFR
jgi:hypothetical protein